MNSRLNRMMKRSFDLIVASLILVVIAVPLAMIWAVVRISSPGPAILRQRRIGYKGREFVLYKFRTMYIDCDDRSHREYVTRWMQQGNRAANADGVFKIKDDPRITPVGRPLRCHSLDELAQIFNVLKGDMSLVGPRPALPYEVEAYQPRHMRRLEAVPGITGLWQISGRNSVSFERMIELDIEYLHTWSMGLDLSIMLRTIPIALAGTGH